MRRIGLALALVAMIACGQSAEQPSGTDPVPTFPPTSTTSPTTTTSFEPPPTSVPPMVDWHDSEAVASLADGWTVQACEGEALLLCVSRNGSPVGTVEALSYPVESFPDIDPDADTSSQLRTLADGFFEALGSDRADGCGPDYEFEAIPGRDFKLGWTPALAYGFTGTMPDGQPSELNLQYATIVGDQIVSIVATAYDEGGCPGRDDLSGFTSKDLAAFRPHLEKVLESSPLPEITG